LTQKNRPHCVLFGHFIVLRSLLSHNGDTLLTEKPMFSDRWFNRSRMGRRVLARFNIRRLNPPMYT